MIVKLNMSYSVVISDEVNSFEHFLISVGQSSFIEKMQCRPNIDIPSPLTIFQKISRQEVTRNLSRAADSIKIEKVCLAIDAGKINRNPTLDVTIVHVFSPLEPLLFRVFKEFNGTIDDYNAKIKGVIDEPIEM